MPVSFGENRECFKKRLIELDPMTMLDVGMGYGEIGAHAKHVLPDLKLTGIEIFLPYLSHARSKANQYETIIVGDIRSLIDRLWSFDVITAFDVIEHLERQDGVKVIRYLQKIAQRAVLVSVPIKPYPQGAVDGNEHEAHLDQWTPQEMIDLGGTPIFLGAVTGLFEFKGAANAE